MIYSSVNLTFVSITPFSFHHIVTNIHTGEIFGVQVITKKCPTVVSQTFIYELILLSFILILFKF